jgi:hypothetical protein
LRVALPTNLQVTVPDRLKIARTPQLRPDA